MQHNYKRYCCVYGCQNKRKTKDTLTFFKLPDDIKRREVWLKAIDREDLLDEKNKTKKKFICSEHFDESAIIVSTSKRLANDAVPTKLLPYKSHNNIELDTSGKTSQLSKKDFSLVSTYSHTQSQTDTKAQKNILPCKKEIKRKIVEPNIVKLNQTSKDFSSQLPKKDNILEATSIHTQSQSDTQAQNHILSCKKEIKREIVLPCEKEIKREVVLPCEIEIKREIIFPCEIEIKREIVEPNIEKLNQLKRKAAVKSENTTCTSQSQTKVRILSNETESTEKPKVMSISTQTDLYETANKMTQTTSAIISD